MNEQLSFQLNDQQVSVSIAPGDRLLDVLRGPLGMTGTKEGCGNGECGACTVIVDGRAVNSCLFPALEADGAQVSTVEGLRTKDGQLSHLQQAFVNEGGIQCGFCTPGMIMSCRALLDTDPDPSEGTIRTALIGNLCRCTGYTQIVDSVKAAAAAERGGADD